MPVDSVAVVNETLEFIASQQQITSFTDGTQAAIAASVLYAPTVQVMLRQLDPDFARFSSAIQVTAEPPPPPWSFQYLYPTACVRLRQIRPPASGAGSIADPNNPVPIKANVGFSTVSGVLTKVIWTNQQNALAVFTSSSATEAMWDSVFTDAVVRRLANPMAMALSGRPDFAREILEESARVAMTAEAVDEGNFRRAG